MYILIYTDKNESMLQQISFSNLEFQGIKSFEDKLKQSVQVFWTWWCHKHVWVPATSRKMVNSIC